MLWLGGIAIAFLVGGIVALALSGAEPPHRIQSFSRSSPREQEFERRLMNLQIIGFICLGIAVAIGVFSAWLWVSS